MSSSHSQALIDSSVIVEAEDDGLSDAWGEGNWYSANDRSLGRKTAFCIRGLNSKRRYRMEGFVDAEQVR